MSKRLFYYSTFFLLIAAVLAWTAVFYSLPDGRFKFYALDVGQGDAIFIETPRKAQVLIDGGPDMKVLGQLSAVMPFYDIKLVGSDKPERVSKNLGQLR